MPNCDLLYEIGTLQDKYRSLRRQQKLTKQAICQLVIPFRDKYGLTDVQALQITRNKCTLTEIADMLTKTNRKEITMDYRFDVKQATEQCIEWIRNWFQKNGKNCKAVIGISGGKDSSVAAALLVQALGKDNVFGVLMPQGTQSDIDIAYALCNRLQIPHVVINIGDTCDTVKTAVTAALSNNWSEQSNTNLPARIRMTTLYAVSQTVNGRVCNTCNYSEDYVGYATRYGDSVGDFAPLANFTVEEVKAIGKYLNLSDLFIKKIPSDGLCGKTDEDNLGFSYQTLDNYLRQGILPSNDIKERIDTLHNKNLFKLQLMPSFCYQPD